VLLYVLLVRRLPRKWFDKLLLHVRAHGEPQRKHSILILIARIPWLVKQGLRHLRFGEFSVLTGYTGCVLWKLGLLQ